MCEDGVASVMPDRRPIVNNGPELPLAAAEIKPAHAEATGVPVILPLPEQRLDGRTPLTIASAATARTQYSIDTLARSHRLVMCAPFRPDAGASRGGA